MQVAGSKKKRGGQFHAGARHSEGCEAATLARTHGGRGQGWRLHTRVGQQLLRQLLSLRVERRGSREQLRPQRQSIGDAERHCEGWAPISGRQD